MEYSEIRQRAKGLRMAVLGDFCLDIYWYADMRRSELSRETPHFPLPIVKERMGAGGAGNVVANLLALEPMAVECIGVFGDDWRGREYIKILDSLGARTEGIVLDGSRCTDTYIKPLRKGIADVTYEDPRLDFANYKPLSAETEQRIIAALDGLSCDVLCVCDQMPFGCVTDAVRSKIIEMGGEGMRVVVDSRDRIGLYHGVIVKPNEVEASRALGVAQPCDVETLRRMAASFSRRTGCPAIVTAGERGCAVARGDDSAHIPAVPLTGETDICGAGDTFLAAFSTAFAAGAPLEDAAELACRASAVVVKKIHTTGTASWEELYREF